MHNGLHLAEIQVKPLDIPSLFVLAVQSSTFAYETNKVADAFFVNFNDFNSIGWLS